MMDVPNDVLASHVFPRLMPGDVARLASANRRMRHATLDIQHKRDAFMRRVADCTQRTVRRMARHLEAVHDMQPRYRVPGLPIDARLENYGVTFHCRSGSRTKAAVTLKPVTVPHNGTEYIQGRIRLQGPLWPPNTVITFRTVVDFLWWSNVIFRPSVEPVEFRRYF